MTLPKIADDIDQSVLITARRVLQSEGNAVLAMSDNLPPDFTSVVSLLLQTKGRAVLSGIGKSGHIARKIAATLASTGTPSFFLHPAEASHGDLGMVTTDDACILISNSGETSELGDLISHTRRFSIPLIGISRRTDSTLMKAANLLLTLPSSGEACTIGMVPTTSTTLTLAIGDALAVALMEQRGFVAAQFRTFHPGGKLGAQLAQVHQLMHPRHETPVVEADVSMANTLLEMTEKGFGIACVTEQGKLIGVISDGDLRRSMSGLMSYTAGRVATRDPKTIPPTMLAAEALEIMNRNKVHALVVVDEDKEPVGLLRIHDCLRAGVA